jgi:hypothetical protein
VEIRENQGAKVLHGTSTNLDDRFALTFMGGSFKSNLRAKSRTKKLDLLASERVSTKIKATTSALTHRPLPRKLRSVQSEDYR